MKEKRVIFSMPIKKYADMRIRLRHDGLKQNQLYNWFSDKYLSNDQIAVEMVEQLKFALAKQGKRRILKTKSLIKNGREMGEKYGLTEGDLDDIYDIIESELPEV